MHPVLVRGTRAALGAAVLVAPVLAGAQQAAPTAGTPAAGTVEVGVFGQYNILKKSTTDFTSNTPTTLGLRANIAIGGGLGLEVEGSRAGTTLRARPGLLDRDASYQQLAARATFTSTADGFMAASSAAPIMPSVSAVPGTARITQSNSASRARHWSGASVPSPGERRTLVTSTPKPVSARSTR